MNYDPYGCQRLAVHIINQAVKDAEAVDPELRNDALVFFQGPFYQDLATGLGRELNEMPIIIRAGNNE